MSRNRKDLATILVFFISLPALASDSDCTPLNNWSFTQAGTITPVSVRAGYSLTDPAQHISMPEGEYRTTIPPETLKIYKNPAILIPAVGGLSGIEIGNVKTAIPFADYASVGPVFKISKSDDSGLDAKIRIEISGDRSSYAGFWKGIPEVCEFGVASHRQALDELWQRRIPNILAVLCLGLMAIFATIYAYTLGRFQVYKLFSLSMGIWAVYFSVLSGFVRSLSYEFGTAAIFPARVLAGVGLLLLYYSYRDRPLRRFDRAIFFASWGLVVLSAWAGYSGSLPAQVVLLLLVVPLQIPVTWSILKVARNSVRQSGIAVATAITFSGLVLDLGKLVGPMFGFFSPLPYLERATLVPVLLCSGAYFIWHFVQYYQRVRVTDFQHRVLGHLALRLASVELTEDALIRLTRAARRIHHARRTSVAKRTESGTYQVCGVSGFDPTAAGALISTEKFDHIRTSIATGAIGVAHLKVESGSRYRGGFSLAVPVPLKPNPEYLLFVSDTRPGYDFRETDLAISRQFYTGLGAALIARSERLQREIRERDFQNLVKKLDPNLFEFIQRNVDLDQVTVDETCERGVVFFDQKAYTTILEGLHPDQAAEALRHIKKWVSECAFRQNARIKGFYGDAFVIEVYPLHSETRTNTVIRTTQVAWDLCEGVDELNRELVTAGLPIISFRFGAHFGLAANVDVDLIAAGTTTLIGDAVNLAQRIQSHAVVGTVYVSEQIAGPSRDRFIFESVGNKYVKGRAGLVILNRLVGERSSERGAA